MKLAIPVLGMQTVKPCDRQYGGSFPGGFGHTDSGGTQFRYIPVFLFQRGRRVHGGTGIRRHILRVHEHGKEFVDGDLKLFHSVWQRANEAPVDVDQIGQAIVPDQNWSVLLELSLQSICELLECETWGLFHRHERSEDPFSETTQVSSDQSFDDPSESNLLDKSGPGLRESCFAGLFLHLQVFESNLDESAFPSRLEIRVIFADDLVHKALLHVAQELWDGPFWAFH